LGVTSKFWQQKMMPTSPLVVSHVLINFIKKMGATSKFWQKKMMPTSLVSSQSCIHVLSSLVNDVQKRGNLNELFNCLKASIQSPD